MLAQGQFLIKYIKITVGHFYYLLGQLA